MEVQEITRRTSCDGLQRQTLDSGRADEIRREFGSPVEFCQRFSPNIQYVLRERDAGFLECRDMKYPTIGELIQAYGSKVVHPWVAVMVDNLNDFCGVKKKMTDAQKDEVAHILMCECKGLNIAELALFFIKVKSGEYGEYYGILDTVRTMALLKRFKAESKAAVWKRMEEEAKMEAELRRNERSDDAMSPEDLRAAIDSGQYPTLKAIKEKKVKLLAS